MKKIAFILCLSIMLVFILGNCSGYPRGFERPYKLNETEKATIIEIALNEPEVAVLLKKNLEYRTKFTWYTRDNSNWRSWDYDLERLNSLETPPDVDYRWYPGVIVGIGSPQEQIIGIAVDLAHREAIYVGSQPDFRRESNLNWLSSDEVKRIIDIAFGTPELAEWLDKESVYKVRLVWVAMTNNGGVYSLEYDTVDLGISQHIWTESASLYPGVQINLGDSPTYEGLFAIDMESGEVIYSEILPLRPNIPVVTR